MATTTKNNQRDMAAPPAQFNPDAEDPLPVYITITPQIADTWLERHNTYNRQDSETSWDAYARDMKNDEFIGKNGQTICFTVDEDNPWGFRITDGQHRLMAIRKADKPIRILTVWGVPSDSQKTNDIGRLRTFAENLGLAGEQRFQTLASVLRRGCLWEVGQYMANSGNLKPTHAEMRDFLAAHPEMREHVLWGESHRATGLAGSVNSFCRWLLVSKDAESGAWFMDRLSDRDSLPKDHPINTLSKRIFMDRLEQERGESRHSSDYYVALVFVAWRAFRENRTLKKIQLPPGGLNNDTFPVPR